MRNCWRICRARDASGSVSVNAAGSLAAEARQLHGREIKEVESQLASANIAIYPVDLTGLMSGMESSAESRRDPSTATPHSAIELLPSFPPSRQIRAPWREVAAQTGGKAYINQNEIKDGIALAVSDEKASYSLGYYPENKKWDGKFRSLKVKVDQGDTAVAVSKRVLCR